MSDTWYIKMEYSGKMSLLPIVLAFDFLTFVLHLTHRFAGRCILILFAVSFQPVPSGISISSVLQSPNRLFSKCDHPSSLTLSPSSLLSWPSLCRIIAATRTQVPGDKPPEETSSLPKSGRLSLPIATRAHIAYSGLMNLKTLNFGSGNAGNGGRADSGDAYGGGSGVSGGNNAGNANTGELFCGGASVQRDGHG